MERTTLHRCIFVFLLTMLAIFMTTSVWFSNLAWFLLLVNWIIEGQWGKKWRLLCSSYLLQAFLLLFFVHIIALLWTTNLNEGIHVIQVKLPLLILPLVILTSAPLSKKESSIVLSVYSITIIFLSIYGAIRLLTIDYLPYRQAIPFCSNIRFALNCCVVIYLCVDALFSPSPLLRSPFSKPTSKISHSLFHLIVPLWLIFFLFLIRSYTAIFILIIVSILILLIYWKHITPRFLRPTLVIFWLSATLTLSLFVGKYTHQYYHLSPIASAPLQPFTPNGNPYSHQQDGLIEHGSYINDYVCPPEIERQWHLVSTTSLHDTTANGHTIYATLIRYLNALGLPKDSLGISSLSPTQISEIEQYVANPVYLHGTPLQRMVETSLFALECYRHLHTIRDFSTLERIELWQATINSIFDHPIIGSGAGDAVDDMHHVLIYQHSEIANTSKSSHNQYLTFLASFGILGFVILLFAFLKALFHRPPSSAFICAWLLTVLLSFLTEDTLNTLFGILFCTFFLVLRNTNHQSTT